MTLSSDLPSNSQERVRKALEDYLNRRQRGEPVIYDDYAISLRPEEFEALKAAVAIEDIFPI